MQSLLYALTGMSPQRRQAPKPVRTLFFPLVMALISTGALIFMMTGKGPGRPIASETTAPAVATTPYSTRIGETRRITLPDGSSSTSTKFVLADRKLGALRVSGSFRTGNVNAVRLASPRAGTRAGASCSARFPERECERPGQRATVRRL